MVIYIMASSVKPLQPPTAYLINREVTASPILEMLSVGKNTILTHAVAHLTDIYRRRVVKSAGRASPHASAALSCCAAPNSAPLTTTRPQEPLSEFHRPTYNICNARDQKRKRVRPGV